MKYVGSGQPGKFQVMMLFQISISIHYLIDVMEVIITHQWVMSCHHRHPAKNQETSRPRLNNSSISNIVASSQNWMEL